MNANMKTRMVALLIAGTAFVASGPSSQALPADLHLDLPDLPDVPTSGDGYIDVRTLEPGEIVATGASMEGGGCDFQGFGLTLTGTGTNEGYIVDLRADDDCALVVQESKEGQFQVESGGVPAIERPQSSASASVPGVHVGMDQMAAGAGGSGGSGDPSGQRTVRAYLWMWGWGGPDDRLTIKQGSLTYTYARGIVWTTAQGGSCNTWESWWKVDGCWIDGSGSSSSRSWFQSSGHYHCGDPPSIWPCNMSSPDGYFHSLNDEENGYPDGTYRCNAWYSGQIVAGASYYCSVY